MSPLRLLATVSHLKAIQVTDRLLRPLRWTWAASTRTATAELRDGSASLPLPLEAETLDGDRLTALGIERSLAGPDDWVPQDVPRLWGYRLHGFRWIHDAPRQDALGWIEAWIRANPPGSRPGWEPYCLSLRIREWLEWLASSSPVPGQERILASLAQQMEALRRLVEHHLLGNHLLENAITLCWGGLRLSCARSSAWLRLGLTLLRQALREQVLPDGAHAERSPMYQALVAEGLLRLAGVASSIDHGAADRVERLARPAGMRLLESLAALAHPDGDYAPMNDTALGSAPTWSQLAARHAPELLNDPRLGLTLLPQAGFTAWRGAGGLYLLLDGGGVGLDHQPGHGHAGALSFELSYRGGRLVTNTGIYTYEQDPVRAYDRSTAAHSTIVVDGRNQSDVWASFRCGARIRPRRLLAQRDSDSVSMGGSYIRHSWPAVHMEHRRVVGIRRTLIRVLDRLKYRGHHEAVAHIHLAPAVLARREGDAIVLTRRGEAVARIEDAGTWTIGSSPYHPEFGTETERVCLTRSVAFEDDLELSTCLRLL